MPAELAESLESLTSPSTLRSCSSSGWTSSRSISCGLAPRHWQSTVIVGIWTSGVSCTGIERIESTPKSVTRITPTATLTGLVTQDSMRIMELTAGSRLARRVVADHSVGGVKVTCMPGRSRSLPRTTTSAPGSSVPRTAT